MEYGRRRFVGDDALIFIGILSHGCASGHKQAVTISLCILVFGSSTRKRESEVNYIPYFQDHKEHHKETQPVTRRLIQREA